MKLIHFAFVLACLLPLIMTMCMDSCMVNAQSDENEPIIGIDLGTTYSCVGIYKDGQVHLIANDQGSRITPSYVAFDGSQRLIGDAAKNQASLNPANTIFDAKRLIGRKYDDPSVQRDKKLLPFELVNKRSKPHVKVEVDGSPTLFAAEEISAMVLQKMKQIAENYLGQNVTKAIITVPAYFNDAQRQATRDAATIAGLKAERIMAEPTAASVAFGLNKHRDGKEKNILVYDLGGGTFDVSLLTLDDGVFEVLATNGDTHLGGEDFDQNVMKYFVKLIKKKYKVDVSANKRALSRLRREVEKAKRSLSNVHQTKLQIDALIDGTDFSETLTRARFEELNNHLFRKTLTPVAKVLKDAGLQKHEVHDIVLVGGSTRIPKIQGLLRDYFNGKEPHRGINPDEAVAYGASVMGAIISGAFKDQEIVIVDVTPLSLGIETVGGVMTKLIDRNSVIPTRKSKVFSTAQDNQPAVEIQVYQGERTMAKHNMLLGKFSLEGIPAAPRGVPQIEVTFEIDVNGQVHVEAKDKVTGKSRNITIRDATKLDAAEVERMQAEAKKYADQDSEFKSKVDAYNELEGYTYQMKQQIGDEKGLGGKLSAEDKSQIGDAVQSAVEWLDSHSVESGSASADDYKERKAELEAVCKPIIQNLYQNTQAGPNTQGTDDDFSDHEDL